MYISGASGDDINEYTLSTAFDISSTVTHKGSYSVSSSDGGSGALVFLLIMMEQNFLLQVLLTIDLMNIL